MNNNTRWLQALSRRSFMQQLVHKSSAALVLGSATIHAPGVFAALLHETRNLTEGPFYPSSMPLDTDNDLLIINDSLSSAVGEITHLTGRVMTASGEPIRNAFVEVWQVDANASYLHPRGASAQADANFQGYGRFLTDSTGKYYFRTVKPVSYTLQGMFRAPHIHLAVSSGGERILTTQIHVRGHKDNQRDSVLGGVRTAEDMATVVADFTPIPSSPLGELAVNFDCVIGRTLEEMPKQEGVGGLARPRRRGGRF